jgi:type III restriction enzyme
MILSIIRRCITIIYVTETQATFFSTFFERPVLNTPYELPTRQSDFSLMDAIECGIVKLPRVPIAENRLSGEMPMYRNLWENTRDGMPKKGRSKAGTVDPLSLPVKLQTALEVLCGHYKTTFEKWQTEITIVVEQ